MLRGEDGCNQIADARTRKKHEHVKDFMEKGMDGWV